MNAALVGGDHDLFPKGISHKKIPPRMTFAVQISLFKSISIVFGGAGLIFEGLTNPGKMSEREILPGVTGRTRLPCELLGWRGGS
jgi:hypothetical protein